MATVTRLNNEIWVIHWTADTSDAVHVVQCGPTSIQLTSTVNDHQVTLYLSQVQGGRSPTEQCEPNGPLKVLASYNGQMQEMVEAERGTWECVPWLYASTIYDATDYYAIRGFGSSLPVSAAFQLILQFKDTSFAEGERQVLSHLSKLLDTQSLSDVTFVVKNEKIGAHSAIVVSASPVLCAMLAEDKFKGNIKTVQVDDIEPVVFKEMLRYIYTGKAPKLIEDTMTEPLFLAAHKYQIESLKDLCEQTLIGKLNMQTVVHYLVMAHLYTAPQLLEASLKCLVKHKKKVWTRPEWKELMKSYPDLFFLASHRMVA